MDLSDSENVIEKVLEGWLLRELRDEVVSRLTWRDPAWALPASRLRFRPDRGQALDVYFLTPVGLGGKFFYKHPVGEALYSAECDVVVEYEEGAVRTKVAQQRLFWVGSADPRGYRISEGFDDLLDSLVGVISRKKAKGAQRD